MKTRAAQITDLTGVTGTSDNRKRLRAAMIELYPDDRVKELDKKGFVWWKIPFPRRENVTPFKHPAKHFPPKKNFQPKK